MKTLIGMLIFSLSAQAFACDLGSGITDTQGLLESSRYNVIREIDGYKAVKNHLLSKLEKGMVQEAVSLVVDDDLPVDVALNDFADLDRQSHSQSGGITILRDTKLDRLVYIVTYYPGDNEAGAIFSVFKIKGKYTVRRLIGQVGDGDIDCSAQYPQE